MIEPILVNSDADRLSTLRNLPTPGHGEVRLSLLLTGGEEAGRASFERLVTALVLNFHPTARAIAANPGDWGIDTFVGRLSQGTISVWQSKYFINGTGSVQQSQIRESFKSVRKAADQHGFTIDSWTLAVPIDFDGPSTQWWDRWKSRAQKTTGITIELWDGSHIEDLLRKEDFKDVRQQWFGWAPSEIPTERPIADPADWSVYDNALFIRQLHAAGISTDQVARRAFFNAEVMTRDVKEREVDAELHALQNIEGSLHQIWHTRFEGNAALCKESETRLPLLYPEVMEQVESYHRANPSRELKDTLVHRSGLVHHLVEAGNAGWVKNFEEIVKASLDDIQSA